jgi:hypothetical protein
VNFVLKDSAINNDRIKGELTSVIASEIRSPTESVEINALLTPPDVTTSITNHGRFDFNDDGKIDDLDLIIYNFYLCKEGGGKWSQAKLYDGNNDGIVDMSDILIVCSYFS